MRLFALALAAALPAVLASVRPLGTEAAAPKWTVVAGPSLPEALTNNAVAAVAVEDRRLLVSFLGLGAGKDFRAITRRAYALDLVTQRWGRLPDVPGPVGRLAATAQAIGERVYVFGGYAVAADGQETTSAALDIYDVHARRYRRGADIPTPVDDSVSGVSRDGLIYLVGGWSKSANVTDVQVYDPGRDRWAPATPILGTPVFGHSGGVVGHSIVYCDGAKMQAPKLPKYVLTPECYRGDIAPAEPTRIAWRKIESHPGPARYRMAAGPLETGELTGVLFVGGTANAYNYDGIGYDGQPSEPLATSFVYDIDRDAWIEGPTLARPTMDHRGLPATDDAWWIVGGLGAGQAVSNGVVRLTLPSRGPRS